jgi:hypothetical protein
MDAHDRSAAFATFETALELSPSLALACILGTAVLSWPGDATRTLEWAERAPRLSPFDPWKFIAYRSLTLAHFLMARYDLAAEAGRAVQSNPGFGGSYMLLAAPLMKLGRAAIGDLLERHPRAEHVDCRFPSRSYRPKSCARRTELEILYSPQQAFSIPDPQCLLLPRFVTRDGAFTRALIMTGR